jgi:F-type H+-transporting ATPase subunit delta
VADGGTIDGNMVSGVAGRYASALFELATEKKSVDGVAKDLGRISALINGSDDFQRLVKSPAFSAGEQTRAVSAVLAKAKIGGLAANFAKLAASNRRLFALPGMISGYNALVAASRGVVAAEVTVASPASAAMKKDIEAALKGVAGKNAAVTIKVDPAIIGGLIVKIGSKMVDNSLKTKLNAMRLAMKEVG